MEKKFSDINLTLNEGGYHRQTPLQVAAEHGAVLTVRHLLATYPEIEVNPYGDAGISALHLAASSDGIHADDDVEERVEIIRLLLQHGASWGVEDIRRQTPLDRARRPSSRTDESSTLCWGSPPRRRWQDKWPCRRTRPATSRSAGNWAVAWGI